MEEFGDEFDAKMGAEAIRIAACHRSGTKSQTMREEIPDQTNSETKRKKTTKRLKLMEAFLQLRQQAGVDGA
jgi:DNA-directed RNA polymerase subunit beta'